MHSIYYSESNEPERTRFINQCTYSESEGLLDLIDFINEDTLYIGVIEIIKNDNVEMYQMVEPFLQNDSFVLSKARYHGAVRIFDYVSEL